MSESREYPEAPRVGVGAVVLKDGHVLLVRRDGGGGCGTRGGGGVRPDSAPPGPRWSRGSRRQGSGWPDSLPLRACGLCSGTGVGRSATRERRRRCPLGAHRGSWPLRDDGGTGIHGGEGGEREVVPRTEMKLTFQARSLSQAEGDVLVVGGYAEEQRLPSPVAALDRALKGLLSEVLRTEKFNGKPEQIAYVHTAGRLPAKRVLVVGLGSRKELDAERVRRAAAAAVR